jgi:hypothetical protein
MRQVFFKACKNELVLDAKTKQVGVGCFAKAKQVGVGCFAKAKQVGVGCFAKAKQNPPFSRWVLREVMLNFAKKAERRRTSFPRRRESI